MLVHVLPDIGPALGRHSTFDLIKKLISAAQESIAGIAEKYKDENIRLLTRVELGASVQKAVRAIIAKETTSFIVIGSTRGNSVKRSILGSTSVA